jgi:hypothetical protein
MSSQLESSHFLIVYRPSGHLPSNFLRGDCPFGRSWSFLAVPHDVADCSLGVRAQDVLPGEYFLIAESQLSGC